MSLKHHIVVVLSMLAVAAPARAALFNTKPGMVGFPQTGMGACSVAQQVTFTNASMAQQSVDAFVFAGTNPGDFRIAKDNLGNDLVNPPVPISVPNGFPITVDIEFCPSAGGSRSAVLRAVLSNGMSAADVPVSGTGLGPKLAVTPNPVDAGGSLLNVTSTIANIVVGNAGGGAVIVTGLTLTGPNADEFAFAKPCADPKQCQQPAVLGPANQNAFEVQLTYTPTFQGSHNATLRIYNDDPNDKPFLDVPIQGKAGFPARCIAPQGIVFPNVRVGLASPPQPLTITNCGSSDLTITSIAIDQQGNPNDFALDTMGAKLPVKLAVGQTLPTTVAFRPTQTGNRSGRVVILSNDPMAPIGVVNLLGTGTISILSVAPGMLDFGNQVVHQVGAPRTLVITNSGSDDASILSFRFGKDTRSSFRYNGLQALPLRVPAMGSVKFDVLALPLAAGTVENQDDLTFTTDDPNTPSLTVAPIKVNGIKAAVSIDPPFGDFGRTPIAGMKTQVFTIMNTGMADLSIEMVNLLDMNNVFSIDLHGGLDNPPVTLSMGAQVSFTVTFTPNGAASLFTGEVDLDFTGDPENAHVHLPLDGEGVPSSISVTTGVNPPTSIDFGQVIAGQASASRTILIKNTGGETLTVTKVSIEGNNPNQFVLATPAAAPFDLRPGDERQLSISYQPLQGPAAHTANLVVTVAGIAQPQQIRLNGTATQLALLVDSAHMHIDFGRQLVNLPSAPVTVALQVPKAAPPVTLTGIISRSPDFWIDASKTQLSLAAGGVTTFEVVFAPTQTTPEHRSGVIEIAVLGLKAPIATVSVEGTAYQSEVIPQTSASCAVARRSNAGGSWLLLLALPALAAMLHRRRRWPPRTA